MEESQTPSRTTRHSSQPREDVEKALYGLHEAGVIVLQPSHKAGKAGYNLSILPQKRESQASPASE